MAQNESKSYFQKFFFFPSYTRRGILFAIFSQYFADIFTRLSSKLRSYLYNSLSYMSQKGNLQFLHQQPGALFQFLQFLHIFFYLKQRFGWFEKFVVVFFIQFLLMRDIFFFQFSYFSITSSSGYQLQLNLILFLLKLACSSFGNGYLYSCFWHVFALICSIICERICYFIFQPYYTGNFKLVTNYFAKSFGEILSFDKSQSNLSLIMVFSSMGMSISTETNFLSSVSLFNPNLGLLALYRCLSSRLQDQIIKGWGTPFSIYLPSPFE